MNFVQPGGVPVATVALPANSYPGTDFASAFFNVSVNRSVSEEECAHFAFVDTRNADGEPIDAEKVKIGAADMEMTSTFSASAAKQAETEYYHSYENGACYEYVLGLGTEGLADERHRTRQPRPSVRQAGEDSGKCENEPSGAAVRHRTGCQQHDFGEIGDGCEPRASSQKFLSWLEARRTWLLAPSITYNPG